MAGPLNLDAATVSGLVADQFPQWAGLPVRAVDHDGWDNRTFRLGDELTVRLPSADWYVEQVDKEHRWLPVLAPQLPLPIPVPVAKGVPGQGFPYPWSIYRWIDGRPATLDPVSDRTAFALAVADFLNALQRVDPTGGPPPGTHNFQRGGPLATYDGETRAALDRLIGRIDTAAASEIWERALASAWEGPPVWFHGDVATGNLLVRDARLAAVIDFGTSGVGDPACDTVLAWTFLAGESRAAFQQRFEVDEGTWLRGQGWALWKTLITLADLVDQPENDPRGAEASRTLEALLGAG